MKKIQILMVLLIVLGTVNGFSQSIVPLDLPSSYVDLNLSVNKDGKLQANVTVTVPDSCSSVNFTRAPIYDDTTRSFTMDLNATTLSGMMCAMIIDYAVHTYSLGVLESAVYTVNITNHGELLTSVSIPITASEINICGDYNGDGTVDIVDALEIASDTSNQSLPLGDTSILARSDVDMDSEITIVDALIIAQYYVGIRNDLNCNFNILN